MHKYILSLGSDSGERLNNLSRAVLLLSRRGMHLAASSVYETSPVDMDSDAPFLNCAVQFRTYLNPEQMLDFCHHVEHAMGRKRTAQNRPRIIDIDIILWSGGEYDSDKLTIPHPRAADRLFVTVPVTEIVPGSFGTDGQGNTADQKIERFCGPDILFLFTPDQV